MKLKIVGIYSITAPSGAVYIGLSRNIYRRWIEHKSTAAYKRTKLNKSISKYGHKAHQFKIIQELPKDISLEYLNRMETACYDIFKKAGFEMLNAMPTGINYIDYESSIRNNKISKAISGKKQSAEQRAKTSARMKKYRHSPEAKAKISLANSRRIWTVESRLKRSLINTGNTHHLGKRHTLESIAKMRESRVKMRKK